jgi:hypothetical protein
LVRYCSARQAKSISGKDGKDGKDGKESCNACLCFFIGMQGRRKRATLRSISTGCEADGTRCPGTRNQESAGSAPRTGERSHFSDVLTGTAIFESPGDDEEAEPGSVAPPGLLFLPDLRDGARLRGRNTFDLALSFPLPSLLTSKSRSRRCEETFGAGLTMPRMDCCLVSRRPEVLATSSWRTDACIAVTN